MGTRHLQTVISQTGEVKISQYGQWDGYPSGQGVRILKYLKEGDLTKYQENLVKIPEINTKQIDEVNKDQNWATTYPFLSRDCGADIHEMIEKGDVQFVSLMEVEEANKWCEGFYTIDFSKNEFTSEFGSQKHTFKLDNLPTEKRYLKLMEREEE